MPLYPYRASSERGSSRKGIKPGYIVLLLLMLYAIAITVAWRKARNNMVPVVQDTRPQGLWAPITGARIPNNPAFLPNAPRRYRNGISQGFDFYNKDAGIPISYGTPVVAVADGIIERIDHDYQELSPEQWEQLLSQVEQQGADDNQLDQLRGRQIWLRVSTGDARGWLVRYGHLADVADDLQPGASVYQGQVIGYVGNSGTGNGVRGTINDSRLRLELWQSDNAFWGEGWDEDALRRQATQLFINP